MSYRYQRIYSGPVQGVILDWAGTTVDYGCFAPVAVFVEVFEERGVPITMAEARGPMGMYKRDHIQAILRMPSVSQRWQEKHGHLPDNNDVDALFEASKARQVDSILRYTDLIPGAKTAIDEFRSRGLKIGSCTGYTRAMMEPLLAAAAEQGYQPDALVCPDDVAAGRPAPWMCFQNAMRLNVYPMASLVKIGDTVPDIEEGLNAGMWTIGIARTGNEIGLSQAEVEALQPDELKRRLHAVYTKLYAAGAHYVVDSLADTPAVLDHISQRMAHGERP
jgi:phosphonoacetaldehyde hydrolase